MSKSIVLSEAQWLKIYNHIAQNYPPSVLLIRNRMKSVLGFTNRYHRVWKMDPDFGHKYLKESIHLDFYNEPKRTMFLLKYSEYLDKSGNTNLDIE